MRTIGFSLLWMVVTTRSLADQSAEVAPSPKLSARLASEIRASLPKYETLPAKAVPPESAPPPADASVLVLPKVVVRENAQRRIVANDLLNTKELDKKLAREFKNSLEGLDALLNGFSLPLISPSMAARGRAAYKARRREELNNFIGSARALDSKSADKMEKAATEMDHADDWQYRVTP